MKLPPLRLLPPGEGRLGADPEAPYTAFIPRLGELGSRFGAGVNRYREFGERPLIVVEEGAEARIAGSRAALAEFAKVLRAVGHPAGGLLGRALAPLPSWRLRTRSLPLTRAHVMGIVNLTDDSFSGDGVGDSTSAALGRAEALRRAGASLIDVGAESARADRPVRDKEEEALVVAKVVKALVGEGHVVSCDTYKRGVAAAALEAGAECVNDISGLTLGPGAAREAALAGAGYVLNYSYVIPKQRPQSPPVYTDVVAETLAWMFDRLDELEAAGLPRERIAIDPGIAFGKSHDEDLQVLRRLGEFRSPGLPLLLAHSRKNFIGSVNGRPPAARDLETHVLAALAYAEGARIFRVHDVEGARRALDIAAAVVDGDPGDFAPGPGSWPWRAGASAAHVSGGEPDKQPPPGQRW